MKYNQLGRTGLFVSEICFGTMTFSGEGWLSGVIGNQSQKEATKLIEKCLAAGVNFIDTADVYSVGQSEIMTGQAIRDIGIARSDVVLATKVFGRMGKGPNDAWSSRGHIMDGVARSLERLKTDHIDLYQIHGTDPITPVEEIMEALNDLLRQNMVRYVGVSNWTAWRIAKANGIADRRGFGRIESLQAYYSVAGRDLERELVPLMQEERIGCLVWSPLAGGYLSGKYSPGRRRRGGRPPQDFRFSAARQGQSRYAGGGDAAHRQGARHVGGAGSAGLCDGQALGHQRDHRRAHGSTTQRQSGSGQAETGCR